MTALDIRIYQALVERDEYAVKYWLECQPIEWAEVCTEPTLNAVDADNECEAAI